MGHGAEGTPQQDGTLQKVDEKMPLLTPLQMGPFHLSHRCVLLSRFGAYKLALLPLVHALSLMFLRLLTMYPEVCYEKLKERNVFFP